MAKLLPLGTAEVDAISAVIAFARTRPTTMDQLKAMVAGDLPPVGDYPAHQVLLPDGFMCVFSFEHQAFGLCRHLSVSVWDEKDPDYGRLPAPRVLNTIGDLFGFKPGRLDHFWIEDQRAVNFVQKED